MNAFHCNRRNLRSMCLLALLVLVIYIPLSILQLISLSDSPGSSKGKNPKEQMSVEVRDVVADEQGNVQLVLNLKINDLLQMLDQDIVQRKEPTSYPPPMNVSLLYNNPSICEKVRDLKYIIYVHSSPGNNQKRDLLRATWASSNLFKKQVTALVFLMGRSKDSVIETKLRNEAKKYHDIVQGDFIDNYKNLTVKGVMALKWVTTYCQKAKFGIKADDDAFVNIFHLIKVLEERENTPNVMACPLWHDNSMPILRDPAKCAKWCVKYNEFPGRKHFPQYCAGLSFSLSINAMREMLKVAATTPFFWIDDVYITGLLPPKVKNMEYVSLLKNFTVKQPLAIAQYNNTNEPITYIFVHGKKPEISRDMWQWTLARLPQDDFDLLSDEFAEKARTFRGKLGLSENDTKRRTLR